MRTIELQEKIFELENKTRNQEHSIQLACTKVIKELSPTHILKRALHSLIYKMKSIFKVRSTEPGKSDNC